MTAVFAWHIIPDRPETAVYLSAREREVAKMRLRGEKGSAYGGREGRNRLDWKEIYRTLLDPRNYISAVSPSTPSSITIK